ncbi:Peroxisomal membrane signal receptor PTS1 [Malassezia psittaci]|uniref:Peroxisomal membrane signal receptor PTS1 n=1 Tax=Malassezia psittaci TaxID=1821823 RepID=A0AAF0F870_9BASI|nr:Peroxisomal membrane signal receptor PTS1 [Malassezia psittaci]
MAFQSMLSGAECSTSNNNLSQFLKHTQTDRSLQRDGMQPGASQGSRQGGFRSQHGPHAAPEMDAFQQNGKHSSAFNMHSLRNEMNTMRSNPGSLHHPSMQQAPPSAWAQEMHRPSSHHAPAPPSSHAWTEQFGAQSSAPQMRDYATSQREQDFHYPQAHHANGPMNMGMGMGMGMRMGMGMGMRSSVPQMPALNQESKQGDRFIELDDAQWEAQFRQLEETTNTKGKQKDDPTTQSDQESDSKDAYNAPQNQAEEKEEQEKLREFQDRLGPTFQDANPRFEELWRTLQDPSALKNNDDLSKWEEQLMQAIQEEDPSQSTHPGGGLGPGELGLNETDGLGPEEQGLRSFLNEIDENGFPLLGDYAYSQDNPYAQHTSPYAEGLRLLENNGSLTDAALLFEVATQRDMQPDFTAETMRTDEERSRAWQKLGESQAMNEHEEKAIQALERALSLDPNNLGAYLSLAVSYINEGYDTAANATLLKYIARTHPHLAPTSEFPALSDQDTNPWARLNYVRELFLKAAREDAANKRMDPEVQIGLGILFYSSASYDQARDCFEAALTQRQDDFQLWNRLGATLANGGNPELATEAYHKALELRPTFTRAIYNLSVSCLNLGAHHQAAEHLLSALTLQRSQSLPDSAEGPAVRNAPPLSASEESESLWSTLRSIFVVMNRMDLANECHVGSNMEQFRKAGFDF